MPRKVDLTGRKRGSLTAISSTNTKTNNGDYIWNFLCDCGNTHQMSLGNFSSKLSPCCKSCGLAKISKAASTHGLSRKTKVYTSWRKMKERCCNKNCKEYLNYGANGITIDPLFLDFAFFYNTLGEPPDDGQNWSLDRIDHKGNYEVGNVRWATDKQQCRNKGMMENNTSGFNGVCWEDKLHPNKRSSTLYAIAQWYYYLPDGSKKSGKKSFSAKKYGLLPAFHQACSYREHIISELNKAGYEYSSNHGKE